MAFLQRSSMQVVVSVTVALMIFVAAGIYFISNRAKVVPEEAIIEREVESPTSGTSLVPTSDTQQEVSTPPTYQGAILAGTTAPLLDFTKSDFDDAVASNKLVVLYFYANWCPICRAEFPKVEEAFNELTSDGVVGFRVNFNDSDTDEFEKELAREHGVAYQHTKVFVRGEEQILKSPETWEKERYIREIQSRL